MTGAGVRWLLLFVATCSCSLDAAPIPRQMLDADAVEKAAFELEEGQATGGWTMCAGENEQCNCVGKIRYGDKGQDKFFVKDSTGTMPCINGQFGGDPAPGAPKKCWCQGAKMAPAKSDWQDCAKENEQCSCTGTIRYGSQAKDRYHIKDDVTGSTLCNNGNFGGDPVPGAPKNCFCKSHAVDGAAVAAPPPNTDVPTLDPTLTPTLFPSLFPTEPPPPPAEAEQEEIDNALDGNKDEYTFEPTAAISYDDDSYMGTPAPDDEYEVNDDTVNEIGQGDIAQNNEDETATDFATGDSENIMNTPISEDNINQAMEEMDKRERSLDSLPASPTEYVQKMVSAARDKVDELPDKHDDNAVKAAVGTVLEQMEREEEIKLAQRKPALSADMEAYIKSKMSTYSSWLTPTEQTSLTTEAMAMTQELPVPQDKQTVDKLMHAIVNRHLKTKRAEEARNLDLAEEHVQTYDDGGGDGATAFAWGPHIEIAAGAIGGVVLLVFAARMVKQRLGAMGGGGGGGGGDGSSGSLPKAKTTTVRQSSSKYGTHATEGEGGGLLAEDSGSYDTL